MALGRALHQRFLPDGNEQAFVWKYSQPVGGRRPRHFHAEPELNLVVRGWAKFGVGEGTVRLAEHELLVFPAGQDHVLLEASPDLYLYAVGLEPSFSAEVLGAALGPVVPVHVHLAPEEFERIGASAATLVDRPATHQASAELWQRLHWLARHAEERSRRRTHVLTRRALKLMSAWPELGLEALAAELRTHASEVSRHFHRDMGTTLVRHRTRLRLLNCIHWVDGGRSLMTAASTAGFGSYTQCHRAFRAELGCGPQQFFIAGVREHMQGEYEL